MNVDGETNDRRGSGDAVKRRSFFSVFGRTEYTKTSQVFGIGANARTCSCLHLCLSKDYASLSKRTQTTFVQQACGVDPCEWSLSVMAVPADLRSL